MHYDNYISWSKMLSMKTENTDLLYYVFVWWTYISLALQEFKVVCITLLPFSPCQVGYAKRNWLTQSYPVVLNRFFYIQPKTITSTLHQSTLFRIFIVYSGNLVSMKYKIYIHFYAFKNILMKPVNRSNFDMRLISKSYQWNFLKQWLAKCYSGISLAAITRAFHA